MIFHSYEPYKKKYYIALQYKCDIDRKNDTLNFKCKIYTSFVKGTFVFNTIVIVNIKLKQKKTISYTKNN